MTGHRAKKRPRDEDSDPLELNSSDSDDFLELSSDDNPQSKEKKKCKLEPSNTDMVRYTALNKMQRAPRGSMGIPAIRALLAKSGSVSKFAAASQETNSGL